MYFSRQRLRVPEDTWKRKSETGVSVVQSIGSPDVLVDAERVGQSFEKESQGTRLMAYGSELTFRNERRRGPPISTHVVGQKFEKTSNRIK